MSFNKFTPIININSSKVNWTIQARAQTVWKGVTRDTQEFRGLNVLFIDDSNCRIHAFINARFSKKFEGILQEGQIYNISNFIVQDYEGKDTYRCVRFNKHIYFAEYTKLESVHNPVLKIQQWAFDLHTLASLPDMEGDKRYLCDVVGVIKDKEPINEFVNENNETKIQKNFTITDGSYSVKVTFFDNLAESLETALPKDSDEPTFIIISSVKVGRFQDELNLTSFPSSRFYLNINHYSIKHLQKRYLKGCFYKSLPEKITSTEKVTSTETILSVVEIKNLNEEYIQKEVVCQVTIKKVDDTVEWFARVCTKCGDELELQENGRYKCTECIRYFSWPDRRFRVCTLCVDSTGTIPIILGDHEIRCLIGKSVFDFDLEEAKGLFDGKFPPQLQDLKDKKYKITLNIREGNVKKTCNIYQSCDIEDFAEEIGDVDAAINNSSGIPEEQENETQVENIGSTKDTPPSKSSTSKNRIRKSPETTDKVHERTNVKKLHSHNEKKETTLAKPQGLKQTPETKPSAKKDLIRKSPDTVDKLNGKNDRNKLQKEDHKKEPQMKIILPEKKNGNPNSKIINAVKVKSTHLPEKKKENSVLQKENKSQKGKMKIKQELAAPEDLQEKEIPCTKPKNVSTKKGKEKKTAA